MSAAASYSNTGPSAGSFSIWHWAIPILLIGIGVGFVAHRLAQSRSTASRMTFMIASVVGAAVGAWLGVTLLSDGTPEKWLAGLIVGGLSLSAIASWLLATLTRSAT